MHDARETDRRDSNFLTLSPPLHLPTRLPPTSIAKVVVPCQKFIFIFLYSPVECKVESLLSQRKNINQA